MFLNHIQEQKPRVLFVQKWDDKLCPKVDDYPIFFATMQEPSKDNSGEKIFVKDTDVHDPLDSHGHILLSTIYSTTTA